jgi:hypothetical protein
MALPLLIYDERRLSPALGYVFDAHWVHPHESLLCILWKFAKENAIAGHELASQVARGQVDAYEGVAARNELVDATRLAHILGLAPALLRAGLLHGAQSAPTLRYCRLCLVRGYHCIVHQLRWLTHCPLHPQQALRTHCRACGKLMPYHFSARVLDAPFRCAHCRNPLVRTKLPPRRAALSAERLLMLTRLRYRHNAW